MRLEQRSDGGRRAVFQRTGHPMRSGRWNSASRQVRRWMSGTTTVHVQLRTAGPARRPGLRARQPRGD